MGEGEETVASFPWIREATFVIYWGDINRDGLEILNCYRVDFQRDLSSILMNQSTYDTYEKYGTNPDQKGKPIPLGSPRPIEQLHQDEHARSSIQLRSTLHLQCPVFFRMSTARRAPAHVNTS